MQDEDPTPPSRILSFAMKEAELIQQLSDDNKRLYRIVDGLANTNAVQQELIQQLKDEIARLKGQKPRPKIPPSKLEGPNSTSEWRKRLHSGNHSGKTIQFSAWVQCPTPVNVVLVKSRFSIASVDLPLWNYLRNIARLVKSKLRIRVSKPGQPKGKLHKKKKTVLMIHEKPIIQPIHIPEGAKFKGFCRYTVQELNIHSCNIQYQLARWQLPDGSYITGKLPEEVRGHYGFQLVAYILDQYHACRVPEALLLDQLRSMGIQMSAGQLNNILLQNKTAFIKEAAELLPIAAKVEGEIQADDTGARHQGQNQYTTIIGNRWFSVFTTTDSKSRINFLKLLQGGKEEFVINADTVQYLSHVNVPNYLPGYIAMFSDICFTTRAAWEQFLQERNITRDIEQRFLTEAALYAAAIQNGIPRDLGVHSDDAGQFDVFRHSLCWIHEERHYRKLIMTTDASRQDLERIREQMWTLYQALKAYKTDPSKENAIRIESQFDQLFQQKTSSPTLNCQLAKTYKKKSELLRVLQRPKTPLHNNSSETCARAAKIKLKISGGTRSELGQTVRDVFLSLKQTCRKLGINFMSFLRDRVRGRYEIPRLGMLIYERALASANDPPHLSLYSFSQLGVQQHLVG